MSTQADIGSSNRRLRSGSASAARPQARFSRTASASPSGPILSLKDAEMLDHLYTTLDHAVLDAYAWSHNLSDEQILERLLALNLERAG
jgi:hypothetical protein